MIYRMLDKEKEINQNKEDITQQVCATRRRHDDIKRRYSYFLHINYLLCSDDRTEKEKDRDIDVAEV